MSIKYTRESLYDLLADNPLGAPVEWETRTKVQGNNIVIEEVDIPVFAHGDNKAVYKTELNINYYATDRDMYKHSDLAYFLSEKGIIFRMFKSKDYDEDIYIYSFRTQLLLEENAGAHNG